MIGAGDHGALAAREALTQLAEGGIDDGELRRRLGALAAMAMREGSVVRPVRVDELALRAALHCVLELRYEVVRVVVSHALRAAAMHPVVVRIYDLAIRDDDGLHGERREERWRVENPLGAYAARGERRHVPAAAKGQRCAHAAGGAEVHEPAGEPMLEWRAARIGRRDRRRGGGRKDGGERAAPAPRELAACAVARKIVVAEAVD